MCLRLVFSDGNDDSDDNDVGGSIGDGGDDDDDDFGGNISLNLIGRENPGWAQVSQFCNMTLCWSKDHHLCKCNTTQYLPEGCCLVFVTQCC